MEVTLLVGPSPASGRRPTYLPKVFHATVSYVTPKRTKRWYAAAGSERFGSPGRVLLGRTYVLLAATRPAREITRGGGCLLHGSPLYLRCPESCNFGFATKRVSLYLPLRSVTDRPTRETP